MSAGPVPVRCDNCSGMLFEVSADGQAIRVRCRCGKDHFVAVFSRLGLVNAKPGDVIRPMPPERDGR